MPTFSEIDFGFRYGSRNAVDLAGYKEGVFDITTDTHEILVNVNGSPISTKSVYAYDYEDQIRSLNNPVSGKLYFAIDTFNLLSFDFVKMQWINVGGSSVAGEIEDIRRVISNISQFKIVILESADAFPTIGVSGTIYFVPRDYDEVDEDTLFDEYVWVEDYGYYEKIGMTTADLWNYYTKEEVNTKVAGLENDLLDVDGRLEVAEDNIENINSTIADIKSSASSTVMDLGQLENDLTTLSNTVQNNADIVQELITGDINDMKNGISTLTNRLDNEITTKITNNQNNISGLTNRLNNEITNKITSNQNNISTLQNNMTNVQNAILYGFDMDFGDEG